jgi:hypothetical protein
MEVHRFLTPILYHHTVAMGRDKSIKLVLALFFVFAEMFGMKFVDWLTASASIYEGCQHAVTATQNVFYMLLENDHNFGPSPSNTIQAMLLIQKMYVSTTTDRFSDDNPLYQVLVTSLQCGPVDCHAVVSVLRPQLEILDAIYKTKTHHINKRDELLALMSSHDYQDLPSELFHVH